MRISALVALCAALARAAAASDSMEWCGDVGQVALPAFGLLLSAGKQDSRGALLFGRGYLASAATVHALKSTVHSTRPDGGRRSFPSGHTSSAFSGAAYLHRRYGWAYGAPAYAAAALTGYSRVRAKRHRLGDVVAGAAIGAAPQLLWTTRPCRVSVRPDAQNSGYGLVVLVDW